MPTTPEFEYVYRWAEVATDGLFSSRDKLEARDQSLENHLRLGYGAGAACSQPFQYTYRWATILDQDETTQIALLEARDTELEHAFRVAGGCSLAYPYRWAQILPGMARGEWDAYAMAEENDRTIEQRFATCSCKKAEAPSVPTPPAPGPVG